MLTYLRWMLRMTWRAIISCSPVRGLVTNICFEIMLKVKHFVMSLFSLMIGETHLEMIISMCWLDSAAIINLCLNCMPVIIFSR